MPSVAYKLILKAMLAEKQIACVYDGHPRQLCPIIIGHSDKQEKVLAYQVGGTSSKGLPPGGQWKCLSIAKMRAVRAQDGAWREGERHSQEQSYVQDVYIDINIHARKRRE